MYQPILLGQRQQDLGCGVSGEPGVIGNNGGEFWKGDDHLCVAKASTSQKKKQAPSTVRPRETSFNSSSRFLALGLSSNMLKSLATKVLNELLQEYVEGFNLDDFSMSGALELNNLTIKPDVLDRFNLPIQLKAGRIGKLLFNGTQFQFLFT